VEPLIVEAIRGDVVEARHRVHAVAVSDGIVVEACGDPALVTFFRSSAKPIQALPIVRERPDLDDGEIAIACASHLHRPDQLEPVRSLLAKAGATEDQLECGSAAPLEHTCSGKHAAMLLLCRVRGWPSVGYRLSSHACQQELLDEVALAAGVDPESLPTAVDGCGVVTYALTLERIAHAYSRLEATPAGHRVADAMRREPDLVSGEVQVDSELMRLGEGWAAKYGAEGLLSAVSGGLGIALKVEDGAPRALRPALAAFLGQLGLEQGAFADAPVENSRGEVVGELRVHRTVPAR
jgi:L-asparaginase II